MNLENIVAVGGLPGLYKMVGNRKNGLLVEDFDKGTTKFCSVRKHQFTPLETCSIYTDTDTTAIKDIFEAMEKNPPIPLKSSSQDLHNYFRQVLPDYDEDRVHISDIKKVIKWFNFLKERDLLKADDSKSKEEKKIPSSEEE